MAGWSNSQKRRSLSVAAGDQGLPDTIFTAQPRPRDNRLKPGGTFGVLQRAQQYRANEGEGSAHNQKIERSDQ
jgi:hypothetical protein